jgi:hypothetical protein
MKGVNVSSPVTTVLDPNGYSSGLTSSMIPWIGSIVLSVGAGVFTWLRTRIHNASSLVAQVLAHESKLPDLEARLHDVETDGLGASVKEHEHRLDTIDANISSLRTDLAASNAELRKELSCQFDRVINVLTLLKDKQ